MTKAAIVRVLVQSSIDKEFSLTKSVPVIAAGIEMEGMAVMTH